jgi:hypothetical protein
MFHAHPSAEFVVAESIIIKAADTSAEDRYGCMASCPRDACAPPSPRFQVSMSSVTAAAAFDSEVLSRPISALPGFRRHDARVVFDQRCAFPHSSFLSSAPLPSAACVASVKAVFAGGARRCGFTAYVILKKKKERGLHLNPLRICCDRLRLCHYSHCPPATPLLRHTTRL